ncbi:unnamed protein product, partial [Ectocarpus sp. 8 AP-2014]
RSPSRVVYDVTKSPIWAKIRYTGRRGRRGFFLMVQATTHVPYAMCTQQYHCRHVTGRSSASVSDTGQPMGPLLITSDEPPGDSRQTFKTFLKEDGGARYFAPLYAKKDARSRLRSPND